MKYYKITLAGQQKHIPNKEYETDGNNLYNRVRQLIDLEGDGRPFGKMIVESRAKSGDAFEIGSSDYVMKIEEI